MPILASTNWAASMKIYWHIVVFMLKRIILRFILLAIQLKPISFLVPDVVISMRMKY